MVCNMLMFIILMFIERASISLTNIFSGISLQCHHKSAQGLDYTNKVISNSHLWAILNLNFDRYIPQSAVRSLQLNKLNVPENQK